MNAEWMAELLHISDVPMTLEARIDCRSLSVGELLELKPGSILRTDRVAGEQVDIHLGGQALGPADLIVLEEKLAARLGEPLEGRGSRTETVERL